MNDSSARSSVSSILSGYSRTTLGIALLITFVGIAILRAFFFSFFSIPSPSMQPALLPGDFVVVWTAGVHARELRSNLLQRIGWNQEATKPAFTKGDVVVFVTPQAARDRWNYQLLVKRVTGTPGDTVFVDEDTPFAGLHRVPTKYQKIELDQTNVSRWRKLIEGEGHRVYVRNGIVYIDSNSASSYTVEHNYYFVEGDNKANSYDSRYWGFVSESAILGEPLLVYWSVQEGVIPTTSTSFSTVPTSSQSSVRWSRIFHRIH
ncbi:MAG: signal peptidase I [Candidatus Kapaibacterium sp.]|jgi:signal peptidase I